MSYEINKKTIKLFIGDAEHKEILLHDLDYCPYVHWFMEQSIKEFTNV